MIANFISFAIGIVIGVFMGILLVALLSANKDRSFDEPTE